MDSFSFITGLSIGLIIGYFYAFIMGYAKLKKIENVVDFLMQESQNRREKLLEEKEKIMKERNDWIDDWIDSHSRSNLNE